MQTTTTSSAARPLPTLRRGNTGDDVRFLQQRLNFVRTTPGLTIIPTLVTDGIFGPITESAVRQFQDLLNLVTDGIVGPRTWTALYVSLPETNVRPFRIQFAAGANSAVLQNAVVRSDRDLYIFSARPGQRLTANITSLENNAVLEIFNSAAEIIQTEATSASLILPPGNDYAIVVGGTRGNANYRLSVTIAG